MWYNFFKKGEEEMPTSKSNDQQLLQLQESLDQTRAQLSDVLFRLTALRDDFEELKSDTVKFREDAIDNINQLHRSRR